MARICEACGSKIGAFSSEWQSTRTGCVCQKCADRLCEYRNDMLRFGSTEIAEAMELIKKNDSIISGFSETSHIGQKFEYVAVFDDCSKRVLLPKRVVADINAQAFWCFAYTDIVSAKLICGSTFVQTDAFGKAIVGGVLFGGLGAIAGMAAAQDAKSKHVSDSLNVEVTVRGYWSDKFKVTVHKGGLAEGDPSADRFLDYAVKLTNRLNEISGYVEPRESQQLEVAQTASDAADEIRKFKALADDGIITQEEFEAKKKQLLGL